MYNVRQCFGESWPAEFVAERKGFRRDNTLAGDEVVCELSDESFEGEGRHRDKRGLAEGFSEGIGELTGGDWIWRDDIEWAGDAPRLPT